MYKIWNGKKLFDGHFYRVTTKDRDIDSHWILCYRYDGTSGFITTHYVNMHVEWGDIFDASICCNDHEIIDIVDASSDDIKLFFRILALNGKRFDMNRKKLEYL